MIAQYMFIVNAEYTLILFNISVFLLFSYDLFFVYI